MLGAASSQVQTTRSGKALLRRGRQSVCPGRRRETCRNAAKGRRVPDSRNSKCKHPGAGVGVGGGAFACSRIGREGGVAGAERLWGAERESERQWG